MSNIKYLFGGIVFSDVKFTKFSDGAESCQLSNLHLHKDITSITVVCDVEDCSRDIMRLSLVKDAIDSLRLGVTVDLTMMYVPFARADRRFTEGASHSLKVFCNILNSLKFDSVTIADPHSDVCTALINNVSIISQTTCFKSLLPQVKRVSDNFILCAPDLGATKKIFDTVMELGHEDYLQAVKIRDVTTGNIVKCDIQCEDLKGRDVVIVDDICDGGNSFKFLAEKLLIKNCGKIILYTTHGIYSQGLESLKGYVDHIFCYNLIETYINTRDIEIFNNKGE